MPSGYEARPARRKRSLEGRVALTTAIAAAIGAALAALTSGFLADHFLRQREDERLRHAAETLATELRATDGSDTSAHHVLADERAEMAHSGLHFALFRDGRAIGGMDHLAPIGTSGCGTMEVSGASMRACTVAVSDAIAVAGASVDPIESLRAPFLAAALLAVVGAALGGALASRRVAAWAVGPLTRLNRAVMAVSPDMPAEAELGAPDGVHEVDAVREALGELLKRLDEALTQARRFSAHAAHELRTPLTTLSAEVDLLLEQRHETEVAAALSRISHSLADMSGLVERLLVLAGPRGRLQGGDEGVSLADVVNDAAARRNDGDRARMVLQLNDEGLVRGDSALLRALVDNALDNALKFSSPEPIEIFVDAAGDRVIFRVVDRGPGIAPADRERVFEAFYRTPTARAQTIGHGVGLALIAHVARAHGGDASFDDVDSGASLRVGLPVWRPA